jgi:hypothetical protein
MEEREVYSLDDAVRIFWIGICVRKKISGEVKLKLPMSLEHQREK